MVWFQAQHPVSHKLPSYEKQLRWLSLIYTASVTLQLYPFDYF